jgi:Spy/CpxP family protein refolding chaperone
MRWMEISRKSKVVALVSVIAVAAVLGAVMFPACANSEDTSTNEEIDVASTNEETGNVCPPLRTGGMGWLCDLTNEQCAELQAMSEEFRNAVQAKLAEWGVEIEHGWLANLTNEQRAELQTMRQEFRNEVKAKLEEWGVKIPAFNGSKGWLSNLTDEQRAELKAMMEEFQRAVQAKLDEWGVEAPAFPNRIGVRGFGPMRRGCGGFIFRGFQMP